MSPYLPFASNAAHHPVQVDSALKLDSLAAIQRDNRSRPACCNQPLDSTLTTRLLICAGQITRKARHIGLKALSSQVLRCSGKLGRHCRSRWLEYAWT